MFKNKFYYLLLLTFFFVPGLVKAVGTNVSTSITSPVWTEANSPYIVSGTIEVTKGATLRIEAGTEVKFNPGAKILVNGELLVLGTAENPVVLTASSTSPKAGDWGGIEFTDKSVGATLNSGEYVSGSIIRNAIIRFSQGIKCDDASPYIANNQFSLNTAGVIVSGDNYSSGGLVVDASAANQNSSLKPVYIVNNNFSDNSVGIRISRNNGRNYVATPAGYSYLGDRQVTAYISGNTINSNGNGLEVLNGDNNTIISNNIRYNFGTGIVLEAASRGNLISKNTINNNNNGIISSSADSLFLQNNIKNNFKLGLAIEAKPLILALNNIQNNQEYNIDNRVYNLSALDNYWGSADSGLISASFRLQNPAATGTAVMTYPIKYQPFLSSESSLSDMFAPIITSEFSTTTVFSKQEMKGIKPVGTAVYFGDTRVVGFTDQSEWTYTANLQLGANNFNISYRNLNGTSGDNKEITITRLNLFAAPSFNNGIATSTSLDSIVLSGAKPTGSGIFLNGTPITNVDNTTTWSYSASLKMGANKFTIVAKDNAGAVSAETSLQVIRTGVPASDIIADEKKLSGKADAKLAAKLSGRLLLQVDRVGLIWYINPADNKRYFISQESALEIFRKLALGITEADLNKIPAPTSSIKGDKALQNRLKGKLLLRVEAKGQISYVDQNGFRHDINAANLMDNFRNLSLGINNDNIRKITVGELK